MTPECKNRGVFVTSNVVKFQKDLTQGSVAGQLIRFAMPFLLSMLIQQSYSMADLLIVSYYAGDASVAGVNNGGQLAFFVIAIAIGLSIGGTILIGQYFGAKRIEDLKETAATVLTMMLAVSVVMAVAFLLFGDLILKLLQVPEESHSEAWKYLVICMCGLPFIFMYNAIAGILRGMGDAKRPLIIIAISSVVSAALNFLFVGYFQMAAAGAAIATVIAQAGCVVAAGIYLSKSGFFFDFKFKSFVIYKDKLRLILKLGIPSGISQVAVNLSFLLLTMLVNGYGVSVAAAAGLAGRFNGFAVMPVIAISSSISMICAQNLGAKRPDRALKTMIVGIMYSLCIGVPFFIVVRLFAHQIMGLMTSSDAAIEAGVIYMYAFSWDYLLVPFVFSFFGLATGAGHTHITMINTFITSIALRIPTALFLSRSLDMGLRGVGLAVPIATSGALIFLLCYVISGRWRSAVINKTTS
ncbi:MAG: MATE family efflux transporter [Oscillospiraceae bacterium]|nr:MATE family efflux transporter [Oscillospiraceae bacterium]